MAPSAEIELDRTELMFMEPLQCAARLRNGSGETLAGVNAGYAPGSPILLLTDVATGEASRHASPQSGAAAGPPVDVPPGATRSWDAELASVVKLPRPGQYEIRALYAWEGGQATSRPARFTVTPAAPEAVAIVSLRGGWTSLSLAAWVNRGAGGATRSLWLSYLDLSTRPRVTSSFHVADLPCLVDPLVSVPPNAEPAAIWIAWVEGGRLSAVYAKGGFSAVRVTPLPRAEILVIPPLLLDPPDPPDAASPGVSVLTYQRTEDAPGRLVALHLDAGGGAPRERELAVTTDPVWGRTAYLAGAVCNTFLLAYESDGRLALQRIVWSPRGGDVEAEDLCEDDLRFVAADVMVGADDSLHGAILAEVGLPGSSAYVFRRWTLSEGRLAWSRATPLAWPASRRIAEAVVRVAHGGAVYALARGEESATRFWLVRDDGGAVPLPVEIHAPVDLLFRDGTDPAIVHADPGRGFQLLRPR